MTNYIAIDGKSGSGKTYLAGLLAKKLNATIYRLDDYGNDYQPFVGIPKLFETMMHKAKGEIVIFEGVGVFDKRFDSFKPFRILVLVPEDIENSRAARRDVPQKNRSADEWKNIWKIWIKAEKGYFDEVVARKADMVVGAEDGSFDIDEIVARFNNS